MFIRTKTVNGRVYRSLEERYREGGKVRSRYIRSLTGEFDRSVDGHANEFADLEQGAAQLAAREAPSTAADKSADQSNDGKGEQGDGKDGGEQGGEASGSAAQ